MNWKHWLSMAVCCAAPLAIGAALSLGLVQLGDLSHWLVVLACPIGMGAMMWLMNKRGVDE